MNKIPFILEVFGLLMNFRIISSENKDVPSSEFHKLPHVAYCLYYCLAAKKLTDLKWSLLIYKVTSLNILNIANGSKNLCTNLFRNV